MKGIKPIISGMHCCMTSAMMAAMAEGGMKICYSTVREATMRQRFPEGNSTGWWEVGSNKWLQPGFAATVPIDQVVKIQAKGLFYLPGDVGQYKIILMRRHPEEIRNSYIGRFKDDFDKMHPNWNSEYYETIRLVKSILEQRKDCDYLELWVDDVASDPLKYMGRILDFGFEINPEKAASVIKKELLKHSSLQLEVA